MREAALKSTIFVGVPRVCAVHLSFSSLSQTTFFSSRADDWRSRWSDRRARKGCQGWLADRFAQVCSPTTPIFDVLSDKRTRAWVASRNAAVSSSRNATPENIDAVISNGMALWNSIYEPHAVKLYEKLGSYHPDFTCTSPSPLFRSLLLLCSSPSPATDAESAQRPTHARFVLAHIYQLPSLLDRDLPSLLCGLYVLGGNSRTFLFSSVHYPVVRLRAVTAPGGGRTGQPQPRAGIRRGRRLSPRRGPRWAAAHEPRFRVAQGARSRWTQRRRPLARERRGYRVGHPNRRYSLGCGHC
jgi:hypothetical protein